MRILLPVAGETPFFPADEFPFPKPLTEIGDKPMIGWAVDNLKRVVSNPRFIFVAMREEASRYSYESIFKLASDGACDTVLLRERTAGALCSCLMAISHIVPDEPLIIANYDQVITADLADLIRQFEKSPADAGVLTFNSTHPRWSYVDATNGEVAEASEKRVISRQAIAGFYWFRRGADFIAAAKDTIFAGDAVNGNFYVAHSLNHMILAGKRVRALPLPEGALHSFYLPHGIEAFERLSKPLQQGERTTDSGLNVLIPAAGLGSRFAEAGFSAPKPFIDVLGKPMITHVQDNLVVRDANYIIMVRDEFLTQAREVIKRRNDSEVRAVAQLTEGTACTVLLARSRIDDATPLLVANSDQLVDFSCQDFIDDAHRRSLDGSILVFRDPDRNPKWSFARLDEHGFVSEVAEKRPISDLATVGIYYFARGDAFVSAAIDMIVRNDRVNGEFYTCPVYNYMIANGARIGIFEVDPSHMHGLGTPDDLQDYLERRGGPGTWSRHDPACPAVA